MQIFLLIATINKSLLRIIWPDLSDEKLMKDVNGFNDLSSECISNPSNPRQFPDLSSSRFLLEILLNFPSYSCWVEAVNTNYPHFESQNKSEKNSRMLFKHAKSFIIYRDVWDPLRSATGFTGTLLTWEFLTKRSIKQSNFNINNEIIELFFFLRGHRLLEMVPKVKCNQIFSTRRQYASHQIEFSSSFIFGFAC